MAIDEQTIRDTVGAFGDNAGRLVELTLQDAERLVGEIDQAIADDDAEAAGFAGHALKSIMKQVDAAGVADLASAIEVSGKAGRLDACIQHNAQLRQCFGETRLLLQSLL